MENKYHIIHSLHNVQVLLPRMYMLGDNPYHIAKIEDMATKLGQYYAIYNTNMYMYEGGGGEFHIDIIISYRRHIFEKWVNPLISMPRKHCVHWLPSHDLQKVYVITPPPPPATQPQSSPSCMLAQPSNFS